MEIGPEDTALPTENDVEGGAVVGDDVNSEESAFLARNRDVPPTHKNTALNYFFRILLFASPYIVGVMFSIFLAVFYHCVLMAPVTSVLNAIPPNSQIMLELSTITDNSRMKGDIYIRKNFEDNSNYLFNSRPPSDNCNIIISKCEESVITGYSMHQKLGTGNCLYYFNRVEGLTSTSLQEISPLPQFYQRNYQNYIGFPFVKIFSQASSYLSSPCNLQPVNSEVANYTVSESGLHSLSSTIAMAIPHYSSVSCESIGPSDPIHPHYMILINTSSSSNSHFCSVFIINHNKEAVRSVACFFGSLFYIFLCLIACDLVKFVYSFFFKKKTE